MGNGLANYREPFDGAARPEGLDLLDASGPLDVPAPRETPRARECWYLDTTDDEGKTIRRFHLQSLPLQIGRAAGLDLVIPAASVSKRHAELYLEGGAVKVRDLNSTNGTFVNRKRITVSEMREGDILHVATFEFRLGREKVDEGQGTDPAVEGETLPLGSIPLSEHFPGGTRELSELLEGSLVFPVFQPIVTLPEGRLVAYEVLGRGLHPGLPRSPLELFRIAESVGRAAELSRVFRHKAVEVAREHEKKPPLLFLNTHPSEIGTAELVASLELTRTLAPELELALEIHEHSAADTGVMGELKAVLERLDIGLAYDDFGLGERFLQMSEAPPDYLKFDISVVKKIAAAATCERRLLTNLIDAAREMKCSCIAEGIETPREAEVCFSVGFGLGQGFVYSEPVLLSGW